MQQRHCLSQPFNHAHQTPHVAQMQRYRETQRNLSLCKTETLFAHETETSSEHVSSNKEQIFCEFEVCDEHRRIETTTSIFKIEWPDDLLPASTNRLHNLHFALSKEFQRHCAQQNSEADGAVQTSFCFSLTCDEKKFHCTTTMKIWIRCGQQVDFVTRIDDSLCQIKNDFVASLLPNYGGPDTIETGDSF